MLGQEIALVHRSHFSVALRHGSDGSNRSDVTRRHDMARINPVPEHALPEEVKLVLHDARSRVAQFTGRELERGIEPLELYAHAPRLFAAMGALGQASGQLTGIDKRTRALAQLKAATMTQCEDCIDVGSLISRQWGLV